MLTRDRSLLGAVLPEDVMPSAPDNELGYWESMVVITTTPLTIVRLFHEHQIYA